MPHNAVRPQNAPPYYSTTLEQLAAPSWKACHNASDESRIPNIVHQPWLHGGPLRWEHILGMISARWIARPDRYVLYFDRKPQPSAQWRCACQHIATECIYSPPPVYVPGTARRLKLMHRPDMMRLDLLIRHGGIFLDHDAYVLRSLDELRRCCPPTTPLGDNANSQTCRAAPVVAGFEQFDHTMRKLNPGVLLAERDSPFLKMLRSSWRNYSTAWDYNCCEVRRSLLPLLCSPVHCKPA